MNLGRHGGVHVNHAQGERKCPFRIQLNKLSINYMLAMAAALVIRMLVVGVAAVVVVVVVVVVLFVVVVVVEERLNIGMLSFNTRVSHAVGVWSLVPPPNAARVRGGLPEGRHLQSTGWKSSNDIHVWVYIYATFIIMISGWWPTHENKHIFFHPAICCRLAFCERMLLSSRTKSQTPKLLKFPKAEFCSMTRHQKHKHMHVCIASGHMFSIGALWMHSASKPRPKRNTEAAAHSETGFRHMATRQNISICICFVPLARRPGNAHPYRTTSPSSAQESRSQTKNAKPCFPSTRFLRIVTSKPHCTRQRCQMATPSAQKQKATASSAPIGIRKGAGAPHAYKHARPSHRKWLTAKKATK